jgi:hypothetical protein
VPHSPGVEGGFAGGLIKQTFPPVLTTTKDENIRVVVDIFIKTEFEFTGQANLTGIVDSIDSSCFGH